MKTSIKSIILGSAFALAGAAQAYDITPLVPTDEGTPPGLAGDAIQIASYLDWDGSPNSNLRNPDAADVEAIIQNFIPGSYSTYDFTNFGELYKDEISAEEGPFAGSYSTEYFNTPTDPEDAVVTFDGGPAMDADFVVVKDGNAAPRWYLFDIADLYTPEVAGAVDWSSIDVINFNDFWPANGAISHISFYGSTTPVPEPSTYALIFAGISLAGVIGYRSRSSKN